MIGWILLLLYVVQLSTLLILEYRHPAKAVAWITVLLLIPVLGWFIYFVMSQKFMQSKKLSLLSHKSQYEQATIAPKKQIASIANKQIEGHPCFVSLLQALGEDAITYHNEIKLFDHASKAYPQMMECIRNAKLFIYMESYIFRSDMIGEKFKQLLIAKAKEGLIVRVIVDGVGSLKLKRDFINELRAAGVKFEVFLPPLLAIFKQQINYRNHRKLLIVDGERGFLGGLNIGDEYLNADPALGYWRDAHIEIKGEATASLQAVFAKDWQLITGEKLQLTHYDYEPLPKQQQNIVQIVACGPTEAIASTYQIFFKMMMIASEKIYMATPYFIPDASILAALKNAALSGVDVRMLFPGIPDSRVVHRASMTYLKELMEVGVKIYQYQRGFMHAKVVIVDRMVASVGTANMDVRSFFSNFELSALLMESKTIELLEQQFMSDLLASKRMSLSCFKDNQLLERAKNIAARLISPLL